MTITGPGGYGKTRLAVRVGADLVDEYPAGVWLVEIASLTEPSLIPRRIASVLGVAEEAPQPLIETLTDYLQSRTALILLDNAERMVQGCAETVSTLLGFCPELRFVTTSQEPLQIPGEVVHRIQALSHPSPEDAASEGQTLSFDSAQSFDAVRLFAARAEAVLPSFALTEENIMSVANICRQLDGNPLAIELAAAQVDALSVPDIAAQLGDRFRLLVRGNRAGPDRQRTLRATVDWSYGLLGDTEKLLLARLSVFAGGWTIQAAEEICTASGVRRADMASLLTHLVKKSVIQAEVTGQTTRYRLLETIHLYGQEKLDKSNKTTTLRRRHREWFRQLAEKSQGELLGSRQGESMGRLKLEHDNFVAALSWSVKDTGQLESAQRLATALRDYWIRCGIAGEGRQWLERVLQASRSQSPSIYLTRALNIAGDLAMAQGDSAAGEKYYSESCNLSRSLGAMAQVGYSLGLMAIVALYSNRLTQAIRLYQESADAFRDAGDPRGVMNALIGLGNAHQHQGNLAGAGEYYGQALAMARESRDKERIASALRSLSNLASVMGDYPTARRHGEEMISILRDRGRDYQLAFALDTMGTVLFNQGDYASALSCMRESVDINRATADQPAVALSLNSLGKLLLRAGEYGEAVSVLREALHIFVKAGDKKGIANSLEDFIRLAVQRGHHDSAAILLGADQALLQRMDLVMPSTMRDSLDEEVADTVSTLGETAFAEHYKQGGAMDIDQIVQYILAYARL